MINIELKESEADLLLNWCEVELEVIEEKDFGDKEHFEYYKEEVNEILNKLRGN